MCCQAWITCVEKSHNLKLKWPTVCICVCVFCQGTMVNQNVLAGHQFQSSLILPLQESMHSTPQGGYLHTHIQAPQHCDIMQFCLMWATKESSHNLGWEEQPAAQTEAHLSMATCRIKTTTMQPLWLVHLCRFL